MIYWISDAISHPKKSDTVRVHYIGLVFVICNNLFVLRVVYSHFSGMLEDGTEFDNSYQREDPLFFRVGIGQVIRGWDIAVPLVKKLNEVVFFQCFDIRCLEGIKFDSPALQTTPMATMGTPPSSPPTPPSYLRSRWSPLPADLFELERVESSTLQRCEN